MTEKAPLNIFVVLSVGFAVFTLVFFGWWVMKDRFIFGHDKFDQVRWMAPAAQAQSCDRGDMVLDLQQRVLRPGLNKAEATVLLGRPAWEDAEQIEYELGVCQWVVHGLRLYFDRDGRLTHTAIVQH